MGFGIMSINNGKRFYSTNTNYTNSWSDDIENAAQIVQKVNAEAAIKSMYKRGVTEQLYVVEIIAVPIQMTAIPIPEKKTGCSIRDLDSGKYYHGAKKPKFFRHSTMGTEQSATIFKTHNEAQKTLDAMLVSFKEDADNEAADAKRYNRINSRTYEKLYQHALQYYQVVGL